MKTPDTSPARDAALYCLTGWRRHNVRAESIIEQADARYRLDSRDRSLAMELVYGVIRNIASLDFILSKFIKAPKNGVSPEVQDALRLAAYQILHLDRVPDHAAVSEAVEQAKRLGGKGAGSFVNGVLRSLIRGRGELAWPDQTKSPTLYLSTRYSYPEWLVKRWLDRFGFDEAEALLKAGNVTPPITLRVNTLLNYRDSLMARFESAGITAEPTSYAPDGLRLRESASVVTLPGYKEGLFAVQDEAAQLVSLLVSPKSGDNVLDACSAPGGKAAHLSALSRGAARVVASDIGLDKLKRLKENIARLRLTRVHPVVADASGPPPFKPLFDGILIDAPCSALGVIRRRPEIKYARKPEDIARMAGLQSGMLTSLAPLVKPGGALVFSTCSTEPEEGEGVVERFLSKSSEYRLDDPRPFLPPSAHELVTADGFIRSFPHRHGTDGFFAARLVRA